MYLAKNSSIHELLVVWQSPHEEFIRMCHHHHPEVVIDESPMGKVERLSELSPVTFFTDGSCEFPHHKTSRFAATAFVLDVCVTNDQRRDMANLQFQLTGRIPNTLQVIAVTRTTGAHIGLISLQYFKSVNGLITW